MSYYSITLLVQVQPFIGLLHVYCYCLIAIAFLSLIFVSLLSCLFVLILLVLPLFPQMSLFVLLLQDLNLPSGQSIIDPFTLLRQIFVCSSYIKSDIYLIEMFGNMGEQNHRKIFVNAAKFDTRNRNRPQKFLSTESLLWHISRNHLLDGSKVSYHLEFQTYFYFVLKKISTQNTKIFSSHVPQTVLRTGFQFFQRHLSLRFLPLFHNDKYMLVWL